MHKILLEITVPLVKVSITCDFLGIAGFWISIAVQKFELFGWLQMNKKLQNLKAPKKKQLQATKLSVEGRGMVKYL